MQLEKGNCVYRNAVSFFSSRCECGQILQKFAKFSVLLGAQVLIFFFYKKVHMSWKRSQRKWKKGTMYREAHKELRHNGQFYFVYSYLYVVQFYKKITNSK